MKILIITGRNRWFLRAGVEEMERRLRHAGWDCDRKSLDEFLRSPPPRLHYDDVAVAGGDGTIHAALPLLSPWPLLVIPAGTGNDFARSVSIRTLADCIRHLTAGRRIRIDTGLVELEGRSEPFLNGAGIGLDGLVARAHERKLPYGLGVVAALLKRPVHRASLTVDGRAHEEETEFFSLIVANGRAFGGGYRLAPNALLDDGLLDVIVIRPLPRLTALRYLGKAREGRHLDHPAVEWFRCRELLVASAQPLPFHLDGEFREGTQLRFQCLPSSQVVYGILPA
ncbi:MAG: hypothetical protein D6679_09735 [Candidatus Hydrogenedentota bacterium]|nr:MAG: hypothetical protein D6679_09735 [Candidatus Hydrogenedentota bacterium]